MENSYGSIFAVAIISLLVLAVKSQETSVEASFSTNPIAVNHDTVFICKVWNLDPEQKVGINGASTVFVRNGKLIQSAPDKISLDTYTSLPDGYTQYELTIKGVELDDAVPYSCAVLTVSGEQVMAVATDSETLEVLDIYLPPEGFPKCSVVENRLSFYAGEELTLSCYSTDGKPSIALLWTRDNVPLSENQTRIEEGDLIFKNMSIALEEVDNGAVFKCLIVSLEFPSNGRECSIGPIAVWPPKMTTTSTVVYNSTDEFDIKRIGGLTLPVFVMVVVGVGLFGIILIILLAIFCARAYHCTCYVHKRSYSMAQGLTTADTLQEGTLRVDTNVYSTTRSAPDPITPPVQYTETVESNRNSPSVQPRYTPNKDAGKRLSVVESALLMAVSKSFSRDKPRDGDEIIYANTSRPSSVIEMSILEKDEDDGEEEEEDHGDSDSGFVNPAYAADNDSPTGNCTNEVTRPSSIAAARSRSASQSEIIYHNTAELPIDPCGAEQDSEPPEYAQVDKSRSRTSTMDSVRNIVEPEAVTTLDDSIIYRNTAELGINDTTPNMPQSPPPVPVNPPSPVTVKKPPYKRAASSVSAGGLEKPSFKPPPPPTPVSPTPPSPTVHSNPIYDDTPASRDESEESAIEKPIISPKPAIAPKPPKKPSYQI